MSYVVVGIDPGLVENGIVVLEFDELTMELTNRYESVLGMYDSNNTFDASATAQSVLEWMADAEVHPDVIFIEAYRERGNSHREDAGMRALISALRQVLHNSNPSVVDNTGVKKVVRPALLRVLGLTKYPTTHHQDLEAAARILVYGMLKEPALNKLLYEVLTAHFDGNAWPTRRM